jgi:hypothetical protein
MGPLAVELTRYQSDHRLQRGPRESRAIAGHDLEYRVMMKNTVRGILGLVLTAAATWLANYIIEQVFGPDEEPA